MLIKTLVVGPIETNCYVVTNEKTLECVLVDPGDSSATILNYIEDNRLKCEAVLLTHAHWDHTGALRAVMEETGCDVYVTDTDFNMSVKGEPPFRKLPDECKFYCDGDILSIAGLEFHIMLTPGHTPGGVTIVCEDAVFTGDTLFRGSCGRVDLPGGDEETELRSLKKICLLEGDYEVYPGHGDSSTLQIERMFNYYCREAVKNY